MAAIAAHQVVIVCGETGSGKTTQLPKIALALGRGKCNAPPGQGRLIGHTQPRRIAASSVAKRIAEELKSPLGEVVGFKVRFQDRLSRNASVKLMTDGILLAETQTDPLLKAYDTLIIDEAHERSLNIDFLLGYLRQILPRRPDLKVIVTSATIDADRFAQHFRSAQGPAPVIMVSGRMFPVEQRWRPYEESRDYGLNEAIAEGVDELWRDPRQGGDILVFLPGEREIREAADHLRGHLQHQPLLRDAQVLPLFARLSQAEQDEIFVLRRQAPHRAGHQRGRDLADRARHPLCDRRRHSARQALQPAQQGRAAAGRADQPGGRQPARRPLRPRGRRHLHPPVRRGRLQRPPALHRPRDPAQLLGWCHPAHEVAAPGRGGGLPVRRGPLQARHHRRLPVAQRIGCGGRQQTC